MTDTSYDKERVTIVILARNEEQTIGDAVASATSWCREVRGRRLQNRFLTIIERRSSRIELQLHTPKRTATVVR